MAPVDALCASDTMLEMAGSAGPYPHPSCAAKVGSGENSRVALLSLFLDEHAAGWSKVQQSCSTCVWLAECVRTTYEVSIALWIPRGWAPSCGTWACWVASACSRQLETGATKAEYCEGIETVLLLQHSDSRRGSRHSGDNSLSPKDPKSSETITSIEFPSRWSCLLSFLTSVLTTVTTPFHSALFSAMLCRYTTADGFFSSA
mmetsp:Transcript_3809/g.8553  ORF Transcript_3809/g.8553 Transcript_3809/m.8553 type:complete len:203 (+) Transcript_3809:266-874(+)